MDAEEQVKEVARILRLAEQNMLLDFDQVRVHDALWKVLGGREKWGAA